MMEETLWSKMKRTVMMHAGTRESTMPHTGILLVSNKLTNHGRPLVVEKLRGVSRRERSDPRCPDRPMSEIAVHTSIET